MKARLSLIACTLACSGLVPITRAQSAPTCSGAINIERVSELKPGATADQFLAAVDAQQAWYKSHGRPDVIVAGRVWEQDPKTGDIAPSATRFVTDHYMHASVSKEQHDAAWDAFVKMYGAVSTIKENIFVCVPASGLPPSMK